MKVKKVLYPLSMTEESTRCLEKAIQLCEENNWEIIILYSYRLIAPKAANDKISQSFKKEIENKANFIFNKIESELLKSTSVKYQFISEVGFMTDRIKINLDVLRIKHLILCEATHHLLKGDLANNEFDNIQITIIS